MHGTGKTLSFVLVELRSSSTRQPAWLVLYITTLLSSLQSKSIDHTRPSNQILPFVNFLQHDSNQVIAQTSSQHIRSNPPDSIHPQHTYSTYAITCQTQRISRHKTKRRMTLKSTISTKNRDNHGRVMIAL